jgi:RHS repeat-associated protein
VETLQGTTTTFDYGYDLAGRLEVVEIDGQPARSYAYDPNGNRLSVTDHTQGSQVTSGVYDAQDRLESYGTATYAYTEAGELATNTDSSLPPGQQTTLYTYDAVGSLTHVTLPDGREITYVIDGQNRRIGKKVDGVLERAWLYQDQLNPVAELDGAGAVVARFVYGSRPHVPDSMVKGGVTYRILSDHLGSVRLVVDAATGAIAQRIDYDEWGRAIYVTGAADFQPFGFAGGLHDPDTGLVRFGARDYDPEVGRWTAKDPIGFVGGDFNLFGYVLRDPVNLRDPTGLWLPQFLGAVTGGVLGAVSAWNDKAAPSEIAAAAAIGAFTGFTATIPTGLASAALVGGVSAFGGNLLGQLAFGKPCDRLDFESAAVSGLAGIAGGFVAGGVSRATGSEAFAAFAGALSQTYFDATARFGENPPLPVQR